MTELSQNLSLTLPDAGEFLGTWAPPLNGNLVILDTLFGATLGHKHTGVAGDGPKINHARLLGIGSNNHGDIDDHIADDSKHQDTKVSIVETFDSSVVATDVTTIRFANSVVEEVSDGVVLITPAPQNEADFAKNAPVVAYESFGGNPGTDLTELGWAALKGGALEPNYLIGSGPSSLAAGITLTIPAGPAQASYYTAILDNFFPHSQVQRVGVKVNSYGSVDPQVEGGFGLWLHILGSKREVIGNSPTAPIEQGLSLVMRTSIVGGALVVSPDWVVRRSSGQQTTYGIDFRNPPGFAHPTGELVYERLPTTFFVGSHETSFAMDSVLNPTEFTLRYYYNAGLIFTRVFTSGDTEPQVAAFYTAVMELMDDLKQVSNPATPDYGQWGFSTTYDTVADVEYEFNIQAFFASSIDELETPRFISLPPNQEPGGPSGDPVCPGNTAWDGVNVGDVFEVGGSSLGTWLITGTFPANGSGTLSSGFTLTSGTSTTAIYCDPPDVNETPVLGDFSALSVNNVEVFGRNLSAPEGTRYRFFAASTNIPAQWFVGGLGGNYLNAGDEILGNLFGRVNDTVRTTSADTNSFQWQLGGGRRTPWNALVNVRATPDYQTDAAFVQEFPEALRVVAATPTSIQTNIYRYRQGVWTLVPANGDFAECDILFISVSAINLPLGVNFWGTASSLGNNYGYQHTNGAEGDSIEPFVTEGPGLDVLWNRIFEGRLDTTSPPTGAPPEIFVATPDEPNQTTFLTNPTDIAEHQVIIATLAPDAFNGGNSGEYQLRLRDTENNNNFAPVILIDAGVVRPKPPVIDPIGTSIGTLTPSTPTVLTLTVGFPDPDMVVTLNTPFGATAGPYVAGDGNVSITGNATEQVWTISALEFTGTAGDDLIVTVTNAAALAAFPLEVELSVDSYTLGVIGGAAGITPAGTFEDGVLVQDVESSLEFFIDTNTLVSPTYELVDVTGALLITAGSVTLGTPDGSGNRREDRLFFATLMDGQTVVPATVQMEITNNPAGTTLTLPGIPVQATVLVSPTIASAAIGTFGSGITDWDITQNDERSVFVQTTAVTDQEFVSIEVAGATAGVVFEVTNTVRRTDLDSGGFAVRELTVVRTSGTPTGTFGLRVNKVGGLVGVLDPAITLTAGITFGDLTNSIVSAQEGHFATFSVEGNFYVTGSNLEVDLLEGPAGPSLLDPALPIADLTVMSPGLVVGSARLQASTLGKDIYIKFTYTDTMFSRTEFSTSTVSARPSPTVDVFTISPNAAGTVGATITIDGSNLAPPAPPANQTAFVYAYQITEVGGPILTNLVNTLTSETKLTYTTDIDDGAAGGTLGFIVNNRTGTNHTFLNLATISGDAGVGDPMVDGFTISGADGGSSRMLPGEGVQTEITITGTSLDVSYVSGVRLETVGFDTELTATKLTESPPGEGVDPEQARYAFTSFDIATQGPTKIVARFTMPAEFVDTNLQLSLTRNPSHPDGAGVWTAAAIDGIAPSDTQHQSLVLVGPQTTSLKPNGDATQGMTRLDSSREFQSKLISANIGLPITFTIRLNQATGKPPVVYSAMDAMYQAKVKYITVSGTGSPFEWNVTCTLPTVDELVDYPEPSIVSTTPVYLGLKLSNGIPLVGGRIGIGVWEKQPLAANAFTVPYVP